MVFDGETTGPDPRRARLITIGAVAVHHGEIVLEDSFEALIRLSHNTSAGDGFDRLFQKSQVMFTVHPAGAMKVDFVNSSRFRIDENAVFSSRWSYLDSEAGRMIGMPAAD